MSDAPGPSGGPLVSLRRVGDVNRSRVLAALVDNGPLSRAELARLAGVTRATIGNIVNSLVEAGVLVEQELRSPQVGKPPRPLWFAPGAALSAVVSLERGSCEAALVDAAGSVLCRRQAELTDEPTRRQLSAAVQSTLRWVIQQAPSVMPGATVTGIGAAVPAMCDATTGAILASSPLPALVGSWLREQLVQLLPDALVVVDTDSRAHALAEKWFGAGRGYGSFASVQLGAGIGAGVVVNGTVFRADHGIGAEFGHTVVDRGGVECRCGRRGCWETVAGTRWLTEQASLRLRGSAASIDDLVERHAEPKVATLLREYADNVAVGLANLMHIYHLQRFVLHGEVEEGGEAIRTLIEQTTREAVFADVREDFDVVLSETGVDASVLGAAALVLSQRFQLAV